MLTSSTVSATYCLDQQAVPTQIDLRSDYERRADGPSALLATAAVKQARRQGSGAVLTVGACL